MEEQSLELLIVLTRERDIMIRHGAYLGQEVDLRNRELELLNEDPLMVSKIFSEDLHTHKINQCQCPRRCGEYR